MSPNPHVTIRLGLIYIIHTISSVACLSHPLIHSIMIIDTLTTTTHFSAWLSLISYLFAITSCHLFANTTTTTTTTTLWVSIPMWSYDCNVFPLYTPNRLSLAPCIYQSNLSQQDISPCRTFILFLFSVTLSSSLPPQHDSNNAYSRLLTHTIIATTATTTISNRKISAPLAVPSPIICDKQVQRRHQRHTI